MATGAVSDGARMVREMQPDLTPGRFAFVPLDGEPSSEDVARARGMYREDEGVTLILDAERAPGALAMRAITLRVHSSLDGVGLTAAVSGALALAGIPANVVAAYYHDHVYVPEAQAETALAVLRDLAAGQGATG